MNNSSASSAASLSQLTTKRSRTPSKKEREQQLLLLAPTASPLQQPRRGSLPISKRHSRQLLQSESSTTLQRPPSTEIYVPSRRTRLQDTPLNIRKFCDSIRPQRDSSSSEEDNEVFVVRSTCSTPRNRTPRLCRKANLSLKSLHLRKSNKMSSGSDSEEEVVGRSKITSAQRKALMATCQVTELEMVELWNQYKFNFPTGRASEQQLKQLIRKVFPRCTMPDFVVGNLQKVFDTDDKGTVSIRELLIAFSMSMRGTPSEKLHWAFRLYDSDGSETIEEEELEDVFVRLCKIASQIEKAQKEAREPKPPKPPTPPPEPEPEPEPEKVEKPKKKKLTPAQQKMANQAQLEINVKTMSNKLSNRSNKKQETEKKRQAKSDKLAKEKAAKEKARLEAEAAAAAAAAAAEAEAAAKAAEEEEEEDEENKEPEFDPRENARATFRFLDVNRDGVLSEDEFVEGCLADPMFLCMLESFNCDFLWGDGIC